MKKVWYCLLLLILTACEEPVPLAVGQLESDRVEVVAESSEPIMAIDVVEGDNVTAGALILRQDTGRLDLAIAEAEAGLLRISEVLAEQLNGPRQETIAAARANLNEARIERDFRARELERLQGLRERNLTSVESVDTAGKLLDSAGARLESVAAQLAELEAGTRQEQIEQTRHQVAQAEAQISRIEFDRGRLTITAPVDGIIDSLPFEVGERPRVGDVVAVMLTGDQPYARVYIPEPQRAAIRVGSPLSLQIDGIEGEVTGSVRRIASEASFTPYFALTERDRSRLAYMAEVTLPDMPERLPEGLPVQALLE